MARPTTKTTDDTPLTVGEFREVIQDLMTHINSRFDDVDRRFELVDKRFDDVDKRFELVDKHFDKMESTMSIMQGDIYDLRTSFARFQKLSL